MNSPSIDNDPKNVISEETAKKASLVVTGLVALGVLAILVFGYVNCMPTT